MSLPDQQTLTGMLNSDFVVNIRCIDCGLSAEYENGPAFKDAGGSLLLADPCIIRCPGCDQACWSTLELFESEDRILFETADNIDDHRDVYEETAIVAACEPCRAITTVGEYDSEGMEFYEAHITLDSLVIPCAGCGALRRAEHGRSNGEDAMFFALHESVSIDCPSCDGERTLEAERGPDEPELGWEFYRCSTCNEAVPRSEVEEK